MTEFRIIPRQSPPLEDGFGFFFEGRILKWKDFPTAFVAAYILRVHPGEIAPVVFVTPNGEPWDNLTKQ